MTSRMRRWEDLRENLQQHIRILADEAWPLDVRESRQALLRPSLSAGWALTEHAAMTRSNYFSGEGSIPCYSLRCAQCPIGEVTLRSAVLLTASKEILQTLLSPEKPQATRNLVTYSLWDTLSLAVKVQGHPQQRLADLRHSGLPGDADHREQIPGRERRVESQERSCQSLAAPKSGGGGILLPGS
ncbi:unnamed protein product [Cladocopium goreaui]|uniref:Uncharacterized protein n=1 Tax=Cladocopium goreaui TaxID=2562237 RepID=A0A9P1D0I9_9DINO|nr:unnamed protein product [Cladocopium goreaui]